MWNKKKHRIAYLESALDAAHRDTERRIEEACDEVRSVANAQHESACGQAIALARENKELLRALAATHRAIDLETGMDDPRIAEGARWREGLTAQPMRFDRPAAAASPSARLPKRKGATA